MGKMLSGELSFRQPGLIWPKTNNHGIRPLFFLRKFKSVCLFERGWGGAGVIGGYKL